MVINKKRAILERAFERFIGIDLKQTQLEKAFEGHLDELAILTSEVFAGLSLRDQNLATYSQCKLLEEYHGVVRGAIITSNYDILLDINDLDGHDRLTLLGRAPEEFCRPKYQNHSFLLWD